MTKRRLLLRNLWRFRAANLAVAAGVAVATAVLTGALMVGDSVRGSLRELAVRRLGPVTHAMAAPGYFPESLAQRIQEEYDVGVATAAVIVRGSATRDAATEARRTGAAGVQIAAAREWAPVERGQCILNGMLADTLGAAVGDTVVLSLPKVSDLPAEATLAHRKRQRRLTGMRLTVGMIATDGQFLDAFSLTGSQRPGPRAWVNLGELQEYIGQKGRVNTVLAVESGPQDRRPDKTFQQTLRSVIELGDYGLRIETAGGEGRSMLTARGTYLAPAVAKALPADVPVNRVLVYLVDSVADASGPDGKELHYSIVAGLSDPPGGPLADGEIAVNKWLADRLGLTGRAGATPIRLSYYARGDDGQLAKTSNVANGLPLTFRGRVVPMAGLGADATLTPAYKGLTDPATVSIDRWDPPAELHIDNDLADAEYDGKYWDDYGAAPKVFVSLATARRMWGQSYGSLNSVRFDTANAETVRRGLLANLDPAAMGLQFRAIRQEQLAAAAGTTDFAGLFVGLSFFLIVAAGLLVALLLRLAVTQRGRQYGLLAALGYTPKAIRRLALIEAMAVSAIGAAVGLAGAVGYTALLVHGLRTWWIDAVGTTAMSLHVQPVTLAIGFTAGLAVAFVAVLWGVRKVGRASAAGLLSGSWAAGAVAAKRSGRAASAAASILTVLGAGLLGTAATGTLAAQWAFMASAAVLLPAGICWLGRLIRPPDDRLAGYVGRGAMARLAIRNAGRHGSRSLLAAGLLAFATFLLITVSAFRQGPPADTHEKASGAGGFTILARADIPLPADPGAPAGRKLAGVRNSDDPLWDRARFVGLRRRAAEDISCLNITRAANPTVLAIPSAETFAGRFTFAETLEPADNPWELLGGAGDTDGPVPVIADSETAQWVLHIKVGQTLTITDAAGRPREIRLVATLAGSIFQGELLMAAEPFARLFPNESGLGVLLVETAPDDVAAARKLLSTELADYGLAVEPTAALLGRFGEVANTYLSTFQMLGALGLMLGAVGLTVVLLRNLIERRAELALLAALGFSGRRRLGYILTENAFLLIAGLLIGLLVGLLAIVPAGREINWPALLAAPVAAGIVALVALTIAAAVGGRRIRPADLRRE